MGLSATHLIMVLLVVVLLFGRGKISELMGDLAKGIKSFKKGMADDEVVAKDADRPGLEFRATEARREPAQS